MDYNTVKIIDVSDGTKSAVDDCIAVEEPLQIIVNDLEVVTIMRTPGNDRELAVGFMFSEGLIGDPGDIQMITAGTDETIGASNTVHMKLKNSADFTSMQRSYEIRSSCGICGRKKIDELFDEVRKISGSLKVEISAVYRMPDIMSSAQRLSRLTRGAHASAFFTKYAEMVACFEDIGRHNALDKLIGHCLIDGIDMSDKVLLLSGRTSYEMMAKALRAGVGVVASISAPSTLAVDIARRGDVALAGMLRGSSMKIYNKSECFVE